MGLILGKGGQPAEGGILRVYNGEASTTIQKGFLVIGDTTSPATVGRTDVISVKISTTGGGLATILGVALDAIAPGETGEICVWGICEVQVEHGASAGVQVAVNDSLKSGTTAGKANDGNGNANRFGYAMTSAAEKVTGAGYWVTAAIDCRRMNIAFGRA